MNKKRKLLIIIAALALVCLLVPAIGVAEGEEAAEEAYQSDYFSTIWALLPPVLAIILAFITKEVYSSLFVGILCGALLYSNFNIETAYVAIFNEGFIAKLSKAGNVGILIFLVMLGALVVMMTRSGGAYSFGRWAQQHVKTRRGAQLATFVLGVLIFVDDYFNCLTVGAVMRPVTDKANISRAKLAYLIDATAAPVCMIAPISSWAAAVTGVIVGYDGLTLFLQAIPYNLYSLLTLFMILFITIGKIDFGPMRRHELNAMKGDLYTTPERPFASAEETEHSERGRVIDLIIPVVILIVCCVLGMIYTGGFFSGESFVLSFSNCDASLGLAMGSVLAFIIVGIYYLCRRVVSAKDWMSSLTAGFKAMVPAILILCFAWTLSGITGLLGADVFVSGIFAAGSNQLQAFLPVIVFLVAVLLSFSTGTSWGTFGILLPLVVAAAGSMTESFLIASISACLAGSVCGDHCSPISDTTIMSSTGAQCQHVNHVSTQIPYALLVAAVSAIGYLIFGFTENTWLMYGAVVVLLGGTLLLIKLVQKSRDAKKAPAVHAE